MPGFLGRVHSVLVVAERWLLIVLATGAASFDALGQVADARRIVHEALEVPLDLDLREVPPPKLAELIEQIRTLVAPGSWSEHGGAGDMTYEMDGFQLHVSQPAPVHEILRDHLARLREARRRSAGAMPPSAAAAPRPAGAMPALTHADVLAKLEQPAHLEIVARPFSPC